MKHLVFDFNKVLLFPKRSVPVDMIMSLTFQSSHGKNRPDRMQNLFEIIDFDHYFEFNQELVTFLHEINQSASVKIHIYTNSTYSIEAPKAEKVIAAFTDSVYKAKDLAKPKDLAASYIYLADEINAKPSEILFIDDTITNTQAAAQAGLHTHHYTNNQDLFAAIQKFLAQSSTIGT